MNIDGQGLTLDTLEDILTGIETALRAKYGDDFYIKPEGVIDNIVTSVGFQELSLQEQIAFVRKQFDPETAEGTWQDALYERLLCYRIQAEKTVVERTIQGVAGVNIAAGEVTIRNTATLDEFENKACTIGLDGKIVADFECVLFGAIDLPEVAEIEVVKMPLGATNVTTGTSPKIDLGRDRETDEEYRVRFRKQKSVNAKATGNANLANLGKYVDNLRYLKIVDKKQDSTMAAGTLKVIANHNTTDATFAQAIFDTIADGIDTIGTTTETLKDDANQDIVINWINADFVETKIRANVKKKTGTLWETVSNSVKAAIIEYINKRLYGLEETVYANEFIIPVFQTDGVENVTDIEVCVNGGSTWGETLVILQTQLAMFNTNTNWITLNEIV